MGQRERHRRSTDVGEGAPAAAKPSCSVSAAWGQHILDHVHGEAAEKVASAAVMDQKIEESRGRSGSVVPVYGLDKELAVKAQLKYAPCYFLPVYRPLLLTVIGLPLA